MGSNKKAGYSRENNLAAIPAQSVVCGKYVCMPASTNNDNTDMSMEVYPRIVKLYLF